jgi:hypothetical protein
LFRANFYPIGLRRKKLLLQKLINTTEEDDLDLTQKKKKPNPLSDNNAKLQALELDFQNHLLDACNGVIYDPELMELLLNLLQHDPPFRMITFRIICSIVCHFSFNKRLECSMKAEHAQMLNKAYQESILFL